MPSELRIGRDDHGLAANGWTPNNYRRSNWRAVVGLEWWQEDRLWLDRGPMGWNNGCQARVDRCFLLDSCMFCGVGISNTHITIFFLLIRPGLNSIYYLFKLIRRPRLILDFALTLVFNHLVLTTYYSAALPTSLFYWVVLLGGAVLTIVVAEQLCIRREMTEGLRIQPDDEDVEEMEMGGLLPRTD